MSSSIDLGYRAAAIADLLAPLALPAKDWFIAGAEGLRLLGYEPAALGEKWSSASHVYLDDSKHPLPEGFLDPPPALPAPMSFCLGTLSHGELQLRIFSGSRYALPLTFLKKITTADRLKIRYGQLKAQARIFSMRAVEVIEAQEAGEDIGPQAGTWVEHLKLWQRIEWAPSDRWMLGFLGEMSAFYAQVPKGVALRRSQQVKIGKRAGVY